MTVTVEEFTREIGPKADQFDRSVLESLAEIPGHPGYWIRAIARDAVFVCDLGTHSGTHYAYSFIRMALSALLNLGPDDWLPNLIKIVEPADAEAAQQLQVLMRAVKKARRAIDERDWRRE